ncbi:hypothetical protein QBC47DRAFT_412108 [Echria macrotheca]|uniref:WW domain-containing protein n=1 Tax=Echria macrotheca TaxID=438768 RepID=A0AAJ0BEX8_9PEZI|nr:hypothetical protein QBC47DRAFT_412108 [Echria macrotheca]
MTTPDDPPPSYEQATGGHESDSAASAPRRRSSIPLRARRSMEDELRALPPGWIRQFDSRTQHQFFVDTRANPPRSIWHHPYDDDVYLASLSPSERQNLHPPDRRRIHPNDHRPDLAAELSTDEDGSSHSDGHGGPRQRQRLGRRLKDKITGSTHEQRVAERERRDAEEREMYEQHLAFRRKMRDAITTGRPQLLGRDTRGNNVYLEPLGRGYPGVDNIHRLSPYFSEVEYRPDRRPGPPGRYIRPGQDMYSGGYGGGGYGIGGGGWNRPAMAYGRPMGTGYGMGGGFLLAPILGGVALGSVAGMMF